MVVVADRTKNFFFFGVARKLGLSLEAVSALYDTWRKCPYALVCPTLCGARARRPPRIIDSGLVGVSALYPLKPPFYRTSFSTRAGRPLGTCSMSVGLP